MKKILLFLLLSVLQQSAFAYSDTLQSNRSAVLVIPYVPAMHLSDADIDIAEGSQMNQSEIRASLRKGIVAALNKNFKEVYDVPGTKTDFVNEDNRDLDVLYHAMLFETDSVYPLKNPSRFSIKDTSSAAKKSVRKETTYINAGISDQTLLPDFAQKYKADYFVILNELDIKTNFDDCLNIALKIYRRDLKVHYSIYDKTGKQLYGDVAVVRFDSNSNNVKEIADKNFPAIANYILQSLDRATK